MKRECRVISGAYVRKEDGKWVRYAHNENSIIIVNEQEWEKLQSQLELIREIEKDEQQEDEQEGKKKVMSVKINTENAGDDKELFVSDLRNMLTRKGSWFYLPNGEKVQGEEAAIKLLRQRIEEGAI